LELEKAGAKVRLLAARLGAVGSNHGKSALEADGTFETMPSVLFDGVVVPDGERAAEEMIRLGQVNEFLKDQYRHCKPILVLGAGRTVMERAGIVQRTDEDWALARDLRSFVQALARHRNWERQTDPPRV
jgi:catalase